MPFTGVTNTAETRVAPWLVENEPVKVQVLGHWPMMPVVGKDLQYARTGSLLPRIGVIVNTLASVPDQSDAATPELFEFNEYQTRFQVGNADRDRLGIPNNPDELEYVLAKIKLWYAYFQHLTQLMFSSRYWRLY